MDKNGHYGLKWTFMEKNVATVTLQWRCYRNADSFFGRSQGSSQARNTWATNVLSLPRQVAVTFMGYSSASCRGSDSTFVAQVLRACELPWEREKIPLRCGSNVTIAANPGQVA